MFLHKFFHEIYRLRIYLNLNEQSLALADVI
jgi:hypothetical protein